MNAASIRRLYPDLSGTERFRLAAQADARGDAAERDHLIATCPKVLVSIRDPEFGAAVTGAIELAEALLRSSAPFMAWLDLLGSMQRHVEGRSAHGSLPRNFPREFVQAARDRAARVLRALQDAFARVCAEGPGLEPDVLLAALAPELTERLRGRQRRVEGATPDRELEAACYEELRRAWDGPATAMGLR